MTKPIAPVAPPSLARRRFFPFLSAVLAIAVVGVSVFAVAATNDLHGQLTDTKSQLADTKSQLAETKSQLADTKSQLAAAQSHEATLETQVSQQTFCIAALTANSAELSRIFGLEEANFKGLATGSPWATALNSWRNAATAATTDDYNAYSAAFDGKFTLANSWVSKANAQIKLANAADTAMTSAIADIDAATSAINAALSTLTAQLASTQATCGF